MKFQVRGTELNSVLSTVIKGFNPKEDNSYIAFNLDVDEEELIITARSRATFFQGKLKAHSIEIGEDEPNIYHLDGVKLKQLVSILPSSPVNIAFSITDETRSFSIKTMVSKYKLPVLSETPLAPVPTTIEYATVDANDFMKVAKDLIRVISTDPSTQEHQVSCMHIKIEENTLQMLATDAYALGSMKITSSRVELEDDKDVLIRHTEVATLLETFATGETLTVVGSKDMFGYIDENGTISLVGVINMNPLDTSQLEGATKEDNVITVDKNELKGAIETVAKLSPGDDTVDIVMEEGNDNVRISNRYGDYIDIKPSVLKLDSPGAAAFATDVILKAINPANSGSLKLEFGNLQDNSPGAVRIVSLQADGSNDESTSLLAIRMVR